MFYNSIDMSKFQYYALGSSRKLWMMVNFLKVNGYKFQEVNTQDPFVGKVFFGKAGYNALLKQDWWLKTDIEIYQVL